MNVNKAIKVGVKDVVDKVSGLTKGVTGAVTGDRSLREEGKAQLDQAHVEPEMAAVEAEEKSDEREDGVLRRVRKL